MKEIIAAVQVNIPMRMLMDDYLDRFLEMGLNPEIGLDALALDMYSVDDCKDVAGRFKEQGKQITVHGPFMDLAPYSADPAIARVTQKRFDQLFERLGAFSPMSLVVHAAYDPRRHFGIKEEWLENTLAFFTPVAQRACELECRLMIENVFEEQPEDMLPLIQRLAPHHAGICLDVGHLNASSLVPLDHWLDTLGPYIGQMHLHDNAGDKDRHLPLGEGTLDFEKIFDFISTKNPLLTLEPHKEEDLYRSLDYIKAMNQ